MMSFISLKLPLALACTAFASCCNAVDLGDLTQGLTAQMERVARGESAASTSTIEQYLKDTYLAHCSGSLSDKSVKCSVPLDSKQSAVVALWPRPTKQSPNSFVVNITAPLDDETRAKAIVEGFSESWSEFEKSSCPGFSRIYSPSRDRHAVMKLTAEKSLGDCQFTVHSLSMAFVEGMPRHSMH